MIPRSFTFDFFLIRNHTQKKDLYIIYFGDGRFSNSQSFLLLYLIAASDLIPGIPGLFEITSVACFSQRGRQRSRQTRASPAQESKECPAAQYLNMMAKDGGR